MGRKNKTLTIGKSFILCLPLFTATLHAATAINLTKQSLPTLNSILQTSRVAPNLVGVSEASRHVDMNQTVHIRMQQTYAGYPVVGGESVLHLPKADAAIGLRQAITSNQANAKMNGYFYNDLYRDLGAAPSKQTKATQSQQALNQFIATYQAKRGSKVATKQTNSELLVYIGKDQKAHWGYLVSFFVEGSKGVMPAKPNAIVDAQTANIIEQWDEIQTLDDEVKYDTGGGFGGNIKMGRITYDGGKGKMHYAPLRVQRNKEENLCYLKNAEVVVKHYDDDQIPNFKCKDVNDKHNKVYWDSSLDKVNDGYSPDNDALFGGQVIKALYTDWYKLPVLVKNGKPMILTMVVHDQIDNAYWDGEKMTFGDGIDIFYPLTSLGVAAHEVSHGFTTQHSKLRYWGQSGGMNEAFSDMAAQAAEFYAYAKNSWQIGPEIFKEEDEALRYMDKPSKDCKKGRKPGDDCSIDKMSQYRSGIDVHYTSGIFNRIFYLLGTSKGYDTRKAFDVMVKANLDYWTPSSTFQEGACGILSAATDLKYNVKPILRALKKVEVEYNDCGQQYPDPGPDDDDTSDQPA